MLEIIKHEHGALLMIMVILRHSRIFWEKAFKSNADCIYFLTYELKYTTTQQEDTLNKHITFLYINFFPNAIWVAIMVWLK